MNDSIIKSKNEALKDIFKSLSYKLHQNLKQANSRISRSQCLDILANNIGVSTWNEFSHSDMSLPCPKQAFENDLHGRAIDLFKEEQEKNIVPNNLDINLANLVVKMSYLDKPIKDYIINIIKIVDFHPVFRKAICYYFGDITELFNPTRFLEEGDISNITASLENGVFFRARTIHLNATFLDIITAFYKKKKTPPDITCSFIYKNKFIFNNYITAKPKFEENEDYVDIVVKVEFNLSKPFEMRFQEIAITPQGKILSLLEKKPNTFSWNKVKTPNDWAGLLSIFPARYHNKHELLQCSRSASPISVFWPKNPAVA